jgi:hypothetical protein
MWRIFFEFLYMISYAIPGKKNRDWFRRNKCFDYRKKFDAIKNKYPQLNWKKMRLAKGGGSLAFIVDDTVFKVRKFYEKDNSIDKFEREKLITDTIAPVLPVQVPKIELIKAGKYIFYKTHFIKGRVLVDLPLKKILAHREKIGKQIGQTIFVLFNTKFEQLENIGPEQPSNNADCGLVHGDMCSNIIVNPKTMDVVGIIDWEYAGYNSLKREFFGIFHVRRKMRLTDIGPIAMWEYWTLKNSKKRKK